MKGEPLRTNCVKAIPASASAFCSTMAPATVTGAMSPKEWNEAGRPDIVERASARKMEILTSYYPEYIPKAIDDLIRARHDIKLPREVMLPGDPRWFT